MKYRLVQLLASESQTANTTKTIDLNLVTPISRIVVRMKGTNTTSTPIAHPAKMISKMEIVDGSDVLYSLSGVQAGAVNFIENGELPFYCCEYESGIQVCATAQINFGKQLWDREFALNPMNFKNPQLKITNAVASGGSTAGTCTLAVFAYLFEDNPPIPRGFLMTKELYSYTLAASGHKYIDLPQDYPFRFVILQSYETVYAWNVQFDYLKFTIDTDRRVLLNNIAVSDFLKAQMPMDKVEEDFAGLGTGSAVSYYQASTYENYGVTVGRSATQTVMICGQPAGPRIQISNDASESFACHENGYAAFGGMNLLMCDKMDPASWLDPAGTQSIQLDITSTADCSGTANVLIQQSRHY